MSGWDVSSILSFYHSLIKPLTIMNSFPKSERLSSKVAIDTLFETGRSFHSTPLKICWLEIPESPSPAQIVISVPKRSFKRAVDRNKIKRQIREAYRKNKNVFYETLENKKVHLMFIFTSKTILEYAEIEEKIILALKRLSKNIHSES